MVIFVMIDGQNNMFQVVNTPEVLITVIQEVSPEKVIEQQLVDCLIEQNKWGNCHHVVVLLIYYKLKQIL